MKMVLSGSSWLSTCEVYFHKQICSANCSRVRLASVCAYRRRDTCKSLNIISYFITVYHSHFTLDASLAFVGSVLSPTLLTYRLSFSWISFRCVATDRYSHASLNNGNTF